MTIDEKIKLVRLALPDHYEIKESKQAGNIYCNSDIGIEDGKYWSYFIDVMVNRFGPNIDVCDSSLPNHTDFNIYFK